MRYTNKQIVLIQENLSTIDIEESFNECFNECHGLVTFGDLSYEPADVLKSVDPIAFEQEVANYADQNDQWVMIGDEYYDLDEVNDLLNSNENEEEE